MTKTPIFTLGVEEEYQIIDPETRDLRSHLSKIVDGAKIILNEQVKPKCTNLCRSRNQHLQNVTKAETKSDFCEVKL